MENKGSAKAGGRGMKVEKEYSESYLMTWNKKQLVEQIIMLTENNNILHDTIEQQYENFTKLLDEAKSTTGRWISVVESLPKGEYETVLVWLDKSRIYDIAVYCTEYGFRPWYAEYFADITPEWENEVTAWMPLPKPYEVEE